MFNLSIDNSNKIFKYSDWSTFLCCFAILSCWLATVREMQTGRLVPVYSYSGYTYEFVASVGTGANYLRALGGICFSLSGLCVMLKGGLRIMPQYWCAAIFVVELYAGTWIFMSYSSMGDVISKGITPFCPLIWIMCFGGIAGSNVKGWKHIINLLLVMTYISIILALKFTVDTPLTSVRLSGVQPRTMYLAFSFWPSAYLFLQDENQTFKRSIINRSALIFCFLLAIFNQSRGWTVLCILTIILKFYSELKFIKSKRIMIFWIVLLILSACLTLKFNERLSHEYSGFLNRVKEDTRSAQYVDYFASLTVSKMLLGLGPSATYGSGDKWIDNQILFVLLHYGSPVLLGYLTLAILPGLLVFIKCFYLGRSEVLVALLWTLAIMGLSTFNAIELTPQNLFILLIGGRCAALWKSRDRILSPVNKKVFLIKK